MADSRSAKKRIRQNIKRRSRNRWRKEQVKEALRAGDRAKAAEQLKLVYKRLDKVAAKGTIHKNAAARKKSRLARKLSKVGE